MTIEAAIELKALYRKRPAGRGHEAVVTALRVQPKALPKVQAVRLAWSQRASAIFRELARQGAASARPEGKSLPIASLRAALQAQAPRALLIAHDLGKLASEEPRPFLDLGEGNAGSVVPALQAWIGGVLRPWAGTVGASAELVDALAAMKTDAFESVRQVHDLPKMFQGTAPFETLRDSLLQVVARACEGKELFEGLGPAFRIIRGASSSNSLTFLSWPQEAHGGLYSMTATFSVETQPFQPHPIVVVRAGKRRWLAKLPKPGQLRGAHRIGLTLLGRESPVAVEVAAEVRKGEVLAPDNPEFLLQALHLQADLGQTLAEQVGGSVTASRFTGLAYSPAYGGSHPIGAGATTLDQLDLVDRAVELLGGSGFELLPVAEPKVLKAPKRAEDLHKALETEALLADVALALGGNDVNEAALAAAFGALRLESNGAEISSGSALAARAKLEAVRQANQARLRRAFGDAPPRLILLARTEDERSRLELIVQTLFGRAISVALHALPPETHGPREGLPQSGLRAKGRFAARVEAWSALGGLLEAEGGVHVLVQAADWYENRPDDRVNKLAGRYALAARANANVQYLRPMEGGARGFANYLVRVQAAVYDLLFGHAGLVSEVGSLLSGAFPDVAARPKAILGLSVITQARQRMGGGQGGKLCLATRVDAASGRTTARVGWHDGQIMRWTEHWEPFFDALKRVAHPDVQATLGPDRRTERESFQRFVADVLDASAAAGDRPLVLIDSTSAASLWPWLTDAGIGQVPVLGEERIFAAERWPGARLVRVRLKRAGRVIERKWTHYDELELDGTPTGAVVPRYTPTLTSRTVRVSEKDQSVHYWVTSGYFQMALPRGLSVYRDLISYVPLAKTAYRGLAQDLGETARRALVAAPFEIRKVSYRIPQAIEVTVARCEESDDPDRIAHLVHQLRSGYGHTAASTTLPAPLFFEIKVRDYMTRFGIDEADLGEDTEASDAAIDEADENGNEVEHSEAAVRPGAAKTVNWEDLLSRHSRSLLASSSLASSKAIDLKQVIGEPGRSPDPLEVEDVIMPYAASNPAAADVDLRTPCLTLPPFVTPDWLLGRISVPNAVLREITPWAGFIRERSGFLGWRAGKLAPAELVQMIWEGLQYPLFLQTLTRVIAAGRPEKEREQYTIFRPFKKRFDDIRRLRHRGSKRTAESAAQEAVRLADEGHADMAESYVFCVAFALSNDPDFLDLARSEPRFAHLGPFLDAVRLGLQAPYDWLEDVTQGVDPAVYGVDLPQGAAEAADVDEPEGTDEDEIVPVGEDEDDGTVASERNGEAWHVAEALEDAAVSQAPPAPHVLRTEVPTGSEALAPAAQWSRAIRRLRNGLEAADQPSVEAASELLMAARQAARAARSLAVEEAERAAWTDVAPLRSRFEDLFDRLAQVAGAGDRPVGWPVVLRREVAAGAEAELQSFSSVVERSEALLAEASAVMRLCSGDLDRLDDVTDLRNQARASAADGLAGLQAWFEALPTETPAYVVKPATSVAPEAVAEHRLHRAVRSSVVTTLEPEPGHSEASANDGSDELYTAFIEAGDFDMEEAFEPEFSIDDPASTEAEKAEISMAAPEEPFEEDPLVALVQARLIELFERQDHALAYHLQVAAAAVFPEPDLPFSGAELRLAGTMGRVDYAAAHEQSWIAECVDAALGEIETQPEDNAFSEARRVLLFGAVAPLALFNAAPAAPRLLETLRGVGMGLAEGLNPLRDLLVETARSGFPITPSLLRMAGAEASGQAYVEALRQGLLTSINVFKARAYKFQLGNKLRSVLVRSDGEVGRLESAVISGGRLGFEAARGFAQDLDDRAAILRLMEAAEARTGNKPTGMDGDARERMVGLLEDIVDRCRDYVVASGGRTDARGQHSRRLDELRRSLGSALERATTALDVYSKDAAPLARAAASFARSALDHMTAHIDGRAPTVRAHDAALALHGPLAWLPDLHFGRSWLPTPYSPETVVQAVLALPSNGDRTPEALAAMILSRIRAGSHVAARRLLESADLHGLSVAQAGDLKALLDADQTERRDALTLGLREARLRVDRVQRMVGVCSQEEAQALLAALDRIIPSELPVFEPLSSRDEVAEPELVLDFVGANVVLEDVALRLEALLEKPRRAITAQLAELEADGRVSAGDALQVRAMVEKGDWLTAGEFLEFIQDGQALPAQRVANPRFRAFYPEVPRTLERLAKSQDPGGDHLERAVDLGPLAYARLSPDRLQDTQEIWKEWQELKRRLKQGNFREDILFAQFATLIEGFGFDKVKLENVDSAGPRGARHVWSATLSLSFPTDADSVLLPEFGSRTNGLYKVCLAARMPSDGEIKSLSEAAGALALVIFVAEAVSPSRRQQLLLHCLKDERRVLVIDEAILLFALSEAESRPLTLLECAQPFSFAAPYRDWGNEAVPIEMFVGRETEYRKLVEPYGSCVVYGGRRLGKTALLKHIESRVNAPTTGVIAAYVNIYDLGNLALPDSVWSNMAKAESLRSLFSKPVVDAAGFRAGVEAWLAADGRRRILVLLDEADRFIQEDAKRSFTEFIKLQSLMDSTHRRFKFVLAGLHNVTRLVHTENPPLKQIASDPQRIGALMDLELADAESLVMRPFAAMGYEFENREDVLRILSYCNYYPVLVQTFCKRLLETLVQEARTKKRPVERVTDAHVSAALESEQIAQDIGETFDYTISKIEDRYALLANIMAERALACAAEGRVAEGISAVEVQRTAVRWWPAAFQEVNRLSVVEDLLDEMEGLGVVRRVGRDRWALRSSAILRLLGDRQKVEAKLLEFVDRPEQPTFEPRSMRRPLPTITGSRLQHENHKSPLTLGQEHDLLRDVIPVQVLFGSHLADLDFVPVALRTAAPIQVDGRRVLCEPVLAHTPEDLASQISARRVVANEQILLVVDRRSAWRADWVQETQRARAVREGRIRVLFVGGAEHLLSWISNPRARRLASAIPVGALEPWSTSLIRHELARDSIDATPLIDDLRRVTGGFNRSMSEFIAGNSGKPERYGARLQTFGNRLLAEANLLDMLGVALPIRPVFQELANWAQEDFITLYELEEGAVSTEALGRLTPAQVIEFGVTLGLLEAETSRGSDEDSDDVRRYQINPLVLAALKAAEVSA